MIVLVTGCAGFIGMHVSAQLLKSGHRVIGIDNLNNYYDHNLKKARLATLEPFETFTFYHHDITDQAFLNTLAADHQNITHIVHLAAQAGVRYSLQNPHTYINTNVMGHLCVVEMARNLPHLVHMVYASTSSVYGANTKLPFCENDATDYPLSLYAATKKSAELISESYAKAFQLASTGLRYFTVYGPWGRPDMALFKFTKAILNDEEIEVYNNGEMLRNFSYIDDIVNGTLLALQNKIAPGEHKLYNIAHHRSETLMDTLHYVEKALNRKACICFKELQNGDMMATKADISKAQKDFAFNPQTNLQEGIIKFVTWYKNYTQFG